MPSPRDRSAVSDNLLLAALPREEYERLSPHLELVRLAPGRVIFNAGDVVRHAFFPEGGMVSLLSTTESGGTIEVAMIGNEGMTGIPIILRAGVSPYRAVVQLACDALRIRGEALRAEFKRGGRLQDLLLRYTNALLGQVTQSAACNRFHTVEERLCRWLLISRDRARADTLPLTQEFLSYMLGVPCASATAAANELQERRLITHSHGEIVILDLAGVAAASCECYRHIRDGIERLLAA